MFHSNDEVLCAVWSVGRAARGISQATSPAKGGQPCLSVRKVVGRGNQRKWAKPVILLCAWDAPVTMVWQSMSKRRD